MIANKHQSRAVYERFVRLVELDMEEHPNATDAEARVLFRTRRKQAERGAYSCAEMWKPIPLHLSDYEV